jgi:hypothetical protein
MNKSSSASPALHARQQSSSQILRLVLPSYLMILLSAQKCFGKCASRMLLLNDFGPDSLGLRLHPSQSSHPSWCGFRT